jgi:hypothetical protein
VGSPLETSSQSSRASALHGAAARGPAERASGNHRSSPRRGPLPDGYPLRRR